jgi:5-hydroxyisourate hydrolase
MSTLSTHALDTATGRPASGLRLMLEKQEQPEAWRAYCNARAEGTEPTGPKPQWTTLGRGVTNGDGRCPDLLPTGTQLAPGIYRMDFDTSGYLKDRGQSGFYPIAQIVFEITADDEHYHIPLLLSPFGFSTYRGS